MLRHITGILFACLLSLLIACQAKPIDGVVVSVKYSPKHSSTVKSKYSLTVWSDASYVLAILPADDKDTVFVNIPADTYSKYSVGDHYYSK
jgi:hypothetical protein